MNSKAARWRKFWGIIACIAAIAYFVPLAVLYVLQRDIIYIPHTGIVGAPAQYGIPQLHVVEVDTEDGLMLRDWFMPPKKKDGAVIVIFHGAYVNIGDVASIARYLMKGDYGIFVCEYRGFGMSPGSPSEQGIYADARAGVKWLQKSGYDARHMVFFGASLGTGVAVQMATEFQPPILVLHAPMSSVADVAKDKYPFYPIDLLLKDRFDSAAKIGQVHAALLIVHGDEDDFIPIKFGRKLFDAANQPKQFLTFRGAKHIDLLFQHPQVYQVINDWIDKQEKIIHIMPHDK